MSVDEVLQEYQRKQQVGKVQFDNLRGPKGDPGRNGRDGRDGKRGLDGLDGVDGEDGENGENGRDGVDGKDGLKGDPGYDGRDGVDGKDGKNGRDGKDGEKGEKGDPGRDGKDGKDGSDGRDGIDGVDGVNAPVIQKFVKNKIGDLIVHFDNGEFLNIGPLPKGPKGDPGETIRQMGGGGGAGKAFVLEQLTNYIQKSTFLNKGDILVFDGDNIVVQPVGADETVLTANSATDTGLSYSEAASSD
jgi:hypothetical protein